MKYLTNTTPIMTEYIHAALSQVKELNSPIPDICLLLKWLSDSLF